MILDFSILQVVYAFGGFNNLCLGVFISMSTLLIVSYVSGCCIEKPALEYARR